LMVFASDHHFSQIALIASVIVIASLCKGKNVQDDLLGNSVKKTQVIVVKKNPIAIG
jgi:hypothetical protein